MKKILSIVLALLIFCLTLCACGKEQDDLSQYMPQKVENETFIATRDENAKGSRSNPYSLNEEIVFSSVNMGLENLYKTTLTINKLSSDESKNAESIYKKRHGYICGETYSISFEIESIKGDNSNSLSDRTDSEGCFLKNGYDESMKEVYFDCFDKTTGEKIYDFYPDTNYDLYMETSETIECKYITLEYRIDKYKTETIWIEIN